MESRAPTGSTGSTLDDPEETDENNPEYCVGIYGEPGAGSISLQKQTMCSVRDGNRLKLAAPLYAGPFDNRSVSFHIDTDVHPVPGSDVPWPDHVPTEESPTWTERIILWLIRLAQAYHSDPMEKACRHPRVMTMAWNNTCVHETTEKVKWGQDVLEVVNDQGIWNISKLASDGLPSLWLRPVPTNAVPGSCQAGGGGV